MINVKKRIEVIQELVAQNTIQSLTYAALECRLTIEQICYERLLISHEYISSADLKTWTPAQVLRQVTQEVSELAATGLQVSISEEPVQDGQEPMTQTDYEKFTYVDLGEQAALSIQALNRLWNALSKVALHVDFQDQQLLSTYGKLDSIKLKVSQTVDELRKFEKANLLMSGVANGIEFRCGTCGSLIKKNADLIKDGQIVSCIKPSCSESYELHREQDEISATRRTLRINCKNCSAETSFVAKEAESLRYGQTHSVTCVGCKRDLLVRLAIVHVNSVTPTSVPNGTY
jgi:DNA-directed RNA polymerase subunit M/transcription elongation factor TFIIS